VRFSIADLCLQPNVGQSLAELLKLRNRLRLVYAPISISILDPALAHIPVFAKR
jgi:hypothetical protein